jgi:hypothetical protein
MRMRTLLIVASIIGISASASAQTAAPKPGKSPRQVRPQVQMGCKLVGTVRGTKLWAGDCAPGAELRGATPSAEPEAPAPPPAPDVGPNPPAAKQ